MSLSILSTMQSSDVFLIHPEVVQNTKHIFIATNQYLFLGQLHYMWLQKTWKVTKNEFRFLLLKIDVGKKTRLPPFLLNTTYVNVVSPVAVDREQIPSFFITAVIRFHCIRATFIGIFTAAIVTAIPGAFIFANKTVNYTS